MATIHQDGDLVIRSYQRSDVDALIAQANNPRVSRFLTSVPYPYTHESAARWIDRVSTPGTDTYWVIECGDRLAGSIGFEWGEGARRHTARFGYWFGEAYWGKGLAARVAKPVVDHAFENYPGLFRLESEVVPDNPAAGRVLEKSGFVMEGRLRKALAIGPDLFDVWLYARVRG